MGVVEGKQRKEKGILRYQQDVKTIAFTLYFHFLVYIQYFHNPLSETSVFSSSPYVLRFLLSALLFFKGCLFAFIASVAVHNTIHVPIFFNEHLNKLFFYLLTCSYGHPVTGFISSHNMSHHRYTQSRKDVFRTTKVQYRWHFLNYILFYSDIAPQILKNDLKYLNAQRKLGRPIFWQFIREFVVLLIYQALWLYIDWRKFLLFVFIPHTVAKLGIVNISILQHDGCDENSKYNGSRNFTGKLFNFLIYNNGYHTIHHFNPGLHWSKVPEAHNKIVKPHIHPNLDVDSIVPYFLKTFIYPAKRVNFDGTPVILPEYGLEDEPWFYDTAEMHDKDE